MYFILLVSVVINLLFILNLIFGPFGSRLLRGIWPWKYKGQIYFIGDLINLKRNQFKCRCFGHSIKECKAGDEVNEVTLDFCDRCNKVIDRHIKYHFPQIEREIA